MAPAPLGMSILAPVHPLTAARMASRVELSAEIEIWLPRQVTLGGLGDISAGRLGTSGAGAGAGGGVTSAAALTSFVCAPANAVESTINPIGNSRIPLTAIFLLLCSGFGPRPNGNPRRRLFVALQDSRPRQAQWPHAVCIHRRFHANRFLDDRAALPEFVNCGVDQQLKHK